MGGYAIEGRLEISLFINNTEFPLDAFNLLNFLHVGWSVQSLLPTFHFSISDVQHVLDSTDLPDGVPIRIVVKPYTADSMIFHFRKFHSSRVFNGACFEYEVDGFLDSVKYWTGTSIAGIRGTSSDVLKQIAQTCGLSYSGVQTNDAQLWMPRNRTYGEFAKRTARRGYQTSTSYMELGINPTGVMRYVNVNALPDPQITLALGQYLPNAYTVVDYRPTSKSGLNNKMTGYQHTRIDQSIVKAETSTKIEQLAFTPKVNAPLLNMSVKGTANRGYHTYGAIDIGNTHPNYENALYQNMRYANLYSMDVEFLLITPTQLMLFDTFSFSVSNEHDIQDTAYAGTYTVVAKALYVVGANYSEKILATRTGTNATYVSS